MIENYSTFVVNVARRPDRRQRMNRILPANLDSEFTTDWELNYDAHTLDTCPPDPFGLFSWEIESENKWFNRPLKKGEICCSIAHWAVWQRIADEDLEFSLILEDDIWFVPGFVDELAGVLSELRAIDPKWELLYLGRVSLEDDRDQVTESLVKPGYSHCTYGYMISQRGAQKLISTNFDQDIIPVDEFLPAMYIKHVRGDVRSRYPPQINAYAVSSDIVGQLPKEIAGSETENSEYVG